MSFVLPPSYADAAWLLGVDHGTGEPERWSSPLLRRVGQDVVVLVRGDATHRGWAANGVEDVVAVDLYSRARPRRILVHQLAAGIVNRDAGAVGRAGDRRRAGGQLLHRPLAVGEDGRPAVPVNRNAESGAGAGHLSESAARVHRRGGPPGTA